MRTIRYAMLGTLALLGAAAAAQPQARLRAEIERDAAPVLGRAALARVRAAPGALLVRGPVSFPYAERAADGSPRPRRPAFAAAVRTAAGWIRLSAGGRRDALDRSAGLELDRLLASPALWTGPAAPDECTDPSGALVLARRPGRERVSAFPCGFAGAMGEAARIVLAGPAAARPAPLPLERFEEPVAARFRHMSGLYEERLIAIRSAAEWQGQWRRLTARQGDPQVPPPVDFSREMLLMAAMGPKPSGGYRVAIDEVVEEPDGLVASVRFVSPGQGCGAIAAVTSPVDIVRLPASRKSVRWVVERRESDCR